MDWVLKHLQLVIAIAGAVAWWISQRKLVQTGGAEAAPPRAEKTFEDPELAERTRRIREEIQRKIEQRAKGYAREQPRPLPVAPAELPPIIREIFVQPALPSAATRQENQRQAEILERQATLAEQLEEARLLKAGAEKRLEFEKATADHRSAARTETRTTVLGDLRTPDALRRAFILREVLGPPVALRR